MNPYHDYKCLLGTLRIIEKDHKIIQLKLVDNPLEDKQTLTPLIIETMKQLDEYFSGKRKVFNLPLAFYGTPFQEKVWNALLSIPYGETRSYKQIAKMIECPKGYRAVGSANNKNPILIIIPCHRVIGANNALVGFACGLDAKQKLLDIEKSCH